MTTDLKIEDLKVGMRVTSCYMNDGRVEYVAHDWAVIRDLSGVPYLVEPGDTGLLPWKEDEDDAE